MEGLLLSSLGEGVLGGRLMLEYQKSLPAQSTLTLGCDWVDGYTSCLF